MKKKANLEDQIWYRIFKVMYILLCIFGVFTMVMAFADNFKTGTIAMLVAGVVLLGIRAGFLYIARGKK